MSLTFPPRITATRLRAGRRVDRYGDLVEDWSVPQQQTFVGVIGYPSATDETVAAGMDTRLDGRTIHLPHDTDVQATDRFELAGESGVWVVDGTPQRWPIRKPGWDHGLVVKLKRLT